MDPDFPNNQPPQQPQQTFQPTGYAPQPTPPQDSQPPVNSQQPSQQPPQQPSYSNDYGSGSDNKTKKLLIIIAALVGLFVIIAIVALAFSNSGKTPVEQPQETVSGEFYVKEPTAVDVESVNNSISDDISGMDTDADFPEDKLSDQNLGL